MECGCNSERDQPVPIVSEENRHCHQTYECGLEHHQEECCIPGAVDHSTVAVLPPLTHHCHPPPRGGRMPPSEPSLSEVGGTESALFSKEVIAFSLFGRIHPKRSKFTMFVMARAGVSIWFHVIDNVMHNSYTYTSERPWNESLSARIAEVQECYKNIPPKLYFSPSSVSLEGIGVYTAELLPQGEYIVAISVCIFSMCILKYAALSVEQNCICSDRF